jgi:hypothetical protein
VKQYAGAVAVAGGLYLLSPLFAYAENVPCLAAVGPVLKSGSVNAEVTTLQQFLNTNADTQVAVTGVGSKGYETDRFGGMTKKAVIKFQEKYASEVLAPASLTKGTGVVGALTRAKLHALCGTVLGVSTSEVAVPALTVMPAAVQPPKKLGLNGALYVPFTNVTFTAGADDVTVTSVTVERVGPSSDQAFANVDLLDEDGFYIDDASFRSNHQAVFNEEFVIPARESRTLLIAGDMADDLTDHLGELAGIKVVSVAASVPTADFVPFVGTYQSMNNTITIGSATTMLSGDDPRGNRTRYINDTGTKFSGVRVTAGSQENLLLSAITWGQSGSAGPTDVVNVTTVVNGATYPTDIDDKLYTTVFPTPLVIAKGNSVDIYVQGDLTVSGANRTVQFNIEYATDILLIGDQYGYGVFPLPEANTDVSGNSVFLTADGTTDGDSLFPYFSGSTVTVSGGTLNSVGKI